MPRCRVALCARASMSAGTPSPAGFSAAETCYPSWSSGYAELDGRERCRRLRGTVRVARGGRSPSPSSELLERRSEAVHAHVHEVPPPQGLLRRVSPRRSQCTGTVGSDKEHPDLLPSPVVQCPSPLHEPGLTSEPARELKEVAQCLPFVAAGRFLEESIEVQLIPLAPQHEGQHTSYGGVAVRERQGFGYDLLERRKAPLRLRRTQGGAEGRQPAPYPLVAIHTLARLGTTRGGSKVPEQCSVGMVRRCAVHKRGPGAFGAREAGFSHRVEFAVRR
jgi:hypothetical protein